MGRLKDQLLKAGLVNEKQVKKAQQEKRKETLQKTAPQKTAEAEEEQRRRQLALAEKAEKDRLLNLQRKEEAERKALIAQVRQMIEAHRQPKEGGDIAYNFADAGVIKKLYVSDPVRGRIAKGQLAIVKLDQNYELVPGEIAEKIRQRDAASVIVHNAPQPTTDTATAENDDPYAAYQVPDDLMW